MKTQTHVGDKVFGATTSPDMANEAHTARAEEEATMKTDTAVENKVFDAAIDADVASDARPPRPEAKAAMETDRVEDDVFDAADSDLEPRPGIVDEIRSGLQFLKRMQGAKGEGFADAVLRGLGQVVFQNNALTGLLILLAISVNSFLYAAAALFGAAVSTYAAKLLRVDKRLVRDGLFGFNGALTGIAMVAFTSKDYVLGDLPSISLTLYIALAAAFSTIVARAFAFLVRNDRVPGLNLPYCVATILLLGALHQFSGVEVTKAVHPLVPLLHSTSGSQILSGETWLYGIGTGLSQILLQDNWLTGVVIVAAIAVNSRIAAAAAIAGSALAVAAGTFIGAGEAVVRSGLLGYNAALTALALGGFFVLLDRAGLIYAVLGAVLTACVWAGLATAFAPLGLPVLTLPFVIVTWLMLRAAQGFPILRTIPFELAISPEINLRRLTRVPARRAQPAE